MRALRGALGASQGRLLRRVFVEGMMLGLIGCAPGLILGAVSLRVILGTIPVTSGPLLANNLSLSPVSGRRVGNLNQNVGLNMATLATFLNGLRWPNKVIFHLEEDRGLGSPVPAERFTAYAGYRFS